MGWQNCVLAGGGPGDGREMEIEGFATEIVVVVGNRPATTLVAHDGRPPGHDVVHMLVARYERTERIDAAGRRVYNYRP